MGHTPPVEEAGYTRRVITAAGVVAALAAVIVFAWYVSQVALIVFASILLGIVLDAMARPIQTAVHLPRLWALALVLTALLALALGFVAAIGPALIGQIAQLGERVPAAVDQIQIFLERREWGRMLLRQLTESVQLLPSKPDLLGRISGVFSTTLGVIVNVGIVVLIGLYLAINPRVYVSGLIRLWPKARRDRLQEVIEITGHALRWWLLGRLTAMVAVGVLTTTGLWLLDIPLALALGFIAGLLSFVPFLGPVISAVPAVLIGLVEGPAQAVYVVVIFAAVQFIEGNFITPLIQLRAVLLPPAVLLTAQLLMGVLFGLFGVFLATPLAVTLIVLVQTLYIEDVLEDSVQVLGRHRAEA